MTETPLHTLGEADSPAPPVICPFGLRVEPIAHFLNFEIVDHPVYDGLELQSFDDAVHGTGMLVFLSRTRDRKVDFYVQSGLELDPATFAIGAGIGEWTETAFEVAELDVEADGVVAEVRFEDLAGRPIEVRVDDRDGRRRHRARLLAPFGATIDRPVSLLLVYMTQFDLLRTSGREPVLRIDGEQVSTGTLPGAWLHRRHLVKYASDLAVVHVNGVDDGPVRTVPSAGTAGSPAVEVRDGAIVALSAVAGGHIASLELDPPLPSFAHLREGERRQGTWRVAIDGDRITGGEWHTTRTGDRAQVELIVTEPWHPRGLPLLMRIVTRIVPTFRVWPTTYRWRASIELSPVPTLTSSWERTGGGGETYRRMTQRR